MDQIPRWQKILLLCLSIFGGIGVLLSIVGLFLPSSFTVGARTTIAAPPEPIFELLNSHEGLQAWWNTPVPGQRHVPMRVLPIDGPRVGVGAKLGFATDGDIFERWTITASVPPRQVAYDVDFGIFLVERTLTLEAKGEVGPTEVAWSETGQLANPLLRYMTVFGTQGVEANFQRALAMLKHAAEARVTAAAEE